MIAAGVGLVVQNSIMVRITQTSSTILIAMLLNSLVGIVLFVTILWFKQGATGFGELVASVRWWTLIPGLLGSFFVFASISGYQKRWRRDDYRGTGRQPVNRRTGAGYRA
ncbi:membrane protein [Salmonella enterica subsp. enterica]|uniref:Membrane protein n=1 Tax=Salmonella enterica I TaxID=59201 RepID=A0A447U2Y6_SALET|nr:membrane protein [Salmonella enterica subsp. enterica]